MLLDGGGITSTGVATGVAALVAVDLTDFLALIFDLSVWVYCFNFERNCISKRTMLSIAQNMLFVNIGKRQNKLYVKPFSQWKTGRLFM